MEWSGKLIAVTPRPGDGFRTIVKLSKILGRVLRIFVLICTLALPCDWMARNGVLRGWYVIVGPH